MVSTACARRSRMPASSVLAERNSFVISEPSTTSAETPSTNPRRKASASSLIFRIFPFELCKNLGRDAGRRQIASYALYQEPALGPQGNECLCFHFQLRDQHVDLPTRSGGQRGRRNHCPDQSPSQLRNPMRQLTKQRNSFWNLLPSSAPGCSHSCAGFKASRSPLCCNPGRDHLIAFLFDFAAGSSYAAV
jgi:hypothetical protein